MKKIKETLAVIPAYNEEKTIGKVIEDIKRLYPVLDILVVDDYSNDKTIDIVKKHDVKLIQHGKNKGGATAMQTGFNYSYNKGYKYTIQIDADGQHPPEEIPKLLKEIYKDEVDIAIGSRFFYEKDKTLCGNSYIRLSGVLFYSYLISKITKQKLTDVTTGFKAINRETCKMFAKHYPSPFCAIESILMLWKRGYKIKEIPVKMVPRFFGNSFLNLKRLILYPIKTFITILKYTLK